MPAPSHVSQLAWTETRFLPPALCLKGEGANIGGGGERRDITEKSNPQLFLKNWTTWQTPPPPGSTLGG